MHVGVQRCGSRGITFLLFLFLGCGSGLSGETLSENGHNWIGLDISQAMLGISNSSFCLFVFINICSRNWCFNSSFSLFSAMPDVAVEREAEGDLLLADMGQVALWYIVRKQFILLDKIIFWTIVSTKMELLVWWGAWYFVLGCYIFGKIVKLTRTGSC